jgi:Nif-specific regulatory protein
MKVADITCWYTHVLTKGDEFMTSTASGLHASQVLLLLNQLSEILGQPKDLEDQLDQVLRLLADYLPVRNSSLALLNREQGEIYIEKAYGLSRQQSKGNYQLGEGITGAVVETGKPLIVPDIWKEPRFLSRTHAREEKGPLSFICIPISYHHEVLGTLSAELFFEGSESLEAAARVLSVIAFMISELVSIHRLEREKGYAENLRLKSENLKLREALSQELHPPNIIGNSSLMRNVYTLIDKVAKTNATTLILGESGVGKELVAEAIHHLSERKDKPFIKFNCAALPEGVIESELFGHERGAFTGAVASRPGRFELAQGGTIFLDEIGEVSPLVQTKLLRVLQEKEVERLGSAAPVKIDARIIAATNKNLEDLMRADKFRQDLYYRLNVFPIVVPPLRERKTDIPLLTDYFIETFSKKFNITVKRISTPAIDMLMSYHWPGNVRELQNCLERAVLQCEDGVIRSYQLPPTLQSSTSSGTNYTGTLLERIDNLEKEMIVDALKESKGNMAKAAKALGLTERAMGLRVHKYDIHFKLFRPPAE